MRSISDLGVKLFADGADLREMMSLYRCPYIRGFTTNPTLMRRAGVNDYQQFAADVLAAIPDRPVSFEVFSDDFDEMEREARTVAAWGPCVYVKIPVTNTRGEPSYDLIHRLSRAGVHVNVTAVLTLDQVDRAARALASGAPSNVSMFAGRIADTGRDPVPMMADAVAILAAAPNAELIWASPRELLNVFQAEAVGCHIITVTADILRKVEFVGKDLDLVSLETVRMFREDALRAGLIVTAEGQAAC
jgi:transaldolase